ncbi:protein kinase subdomain-containing protein PKL/CAK/Fmp29 [Schizopora paradoxa]|uniref:Protein kinase subdomain-containing protein PKL/CAK/Fmp29 n=1 Tax=Schizopora paradoxa TaxID=27342 RepID=A0A0H2RY60_9AGAM|nr:protein kinase subdomain-containing protein PKL/CAK/Fmp29 [Schizopora paradoxa]
MKLYPQSKRRSFSAAAQQGSPIDNLNLNPHDLFEYTSGRWIYNDEQRRFERRLEFNVDEFLRLAAESVKRSPDEIVRFEKLADGESNRVFLVTMRDGFKLIARIPYPITPPKFLVTASEVATLAYLRENEVPVPKVYGYSPDMENPAGTEYIFMEYLEGTRFVDVLFDLDEGEVISILRQVAELENKFMTMGFPAGGSLYFTVDLKYINQPGVPLYNDEFSIGPEASVEMWSGRRGLLHVNRGPYAKAEEVLVGGAEKEKAYLEKYGRPLHPFQRMRRAAYRFQEQQPSDHIKNLERYLKIVPSLLHKPEDSQRSRILNRFCMRHPDLSPANIIISRSPETKSYRVVGIIDWQHTTVLPLSLSAGFTQDVDDDGNADSERVPSLPENFKDLDEASQEREMFEYRRRFLHYHYLESTKELNYLHYVAMKEPMSTLRRRLFRHSRALWKGETLELQAAVMQAWQHWNALTETEGEPCPLAFDAEDIRQTMKLEEEVEKLDDEFDKTEGVFGIGMEGWVPNERYEETVVNCRKLKALALLRTMNPEKQAHIVGHWPFDDMDERDYL